MTQEALLRKCFFLLTLAFPGLSAEISVNPENLTAAVGGEARFTCTSFETRVVDIEWTAFAANGMPVRISNSEPLLINGGVGLLKLNYLVPENNKTTFRCMAGNVQSSNYATLTIQGTLAAVGSLEWMPTQNPTAITLTWTAPFTLDITGVEPDIEGYTVIVSKTDVNSTVSINNYTTTETSFLYTLPSNDGPCFSYLFTVYARNAAGNGEHSNVQYSVNQANPDEVIDIQRISVSNISVNFSLSMSAHVCGAKLIFVDQDTGENTTLNDNNLDVINTTINFNTELLSPRRHFNVTVEAFSGSGLTAVSYTNISESATTCPSPLIVATGTHGISKAVPERISANKVHMKIDFYNQSSTRGALLSLQFVADSNVDFEKSSIMTLARDAPSATTEPSVSHTGTYRIYAYDITSSGTLPDGVNYPADMTDEVDIQNNSQTPMKGQGKCSAFPSNDSIEVRCEALDAVGFQVIAQHTEERRKLYVAKSLDLQTPAVVQVERKGVYQITVLSISQSSGILNSSTEFTKKEKIPPEENKLELLGLLSLVVLIIALIIAIIIAVVVWRHWKKIKTYWLELTKKKNT